MGWPFGWCGASTSSTCDEYHHIGRARRGASGALYPQSALAGLNSLPRFRRRGSCVRRVALTIGSCAASVCEPRQIRKEAAVSGRRRVPQASLIRAARACVFAVSEIDGGCTAVVFVGMALFSRRGSFLSILDECPKALPSIAAIARRPLPP